MWRWLRRIFLATLWVGVGLGTVLTIWLWKTLPGEILGVGWAWFAGAFLVALGLMALNASMEIPLYPLPPEVPPWEEIRRWAFHIALGLLTAVTFTTTLVPPAVLTHLLLLLSSDKSPMVTGILKIVGAAVWVGWFAGTLMAAAWIADQPFMERFRRNFTSLISPSSRDIETLLREVPISQEEKSTFLERLHREGMNPKLAFDIQRTLASYIEKTDHAPGNLTLYSVLYKELNRWLDEHSESAAER